MTNSISGNESTVDDILESQVVLNKPYNTSDDHCYDNIGNSQTMENMRIQYPKLDVDNGSDDVSDAIIDVGNGSDYVTDAIIDEKRFNNRQ